jgi:hypothetical protein
LRNAGNASKTAGLVVAMTFSAPNVISLDPIAISRSMPHFWALGLAVGNYFVPGEPAQERLFEIHLDRLASSPVKALTHLVDDEYSSLFTAWLATGGPPSPTRDERVRVLVVAEIGADARFRLNLRLNALAVIELMSRVPV